MVSPYMFYISISKTMASIYPYIYIYIYISQLWAHILLCYILYANVTYLFQSLNSKPPLSSVQSLLENDLLYVIRLLNVERGFSFYYNFPQFFLIIFMFCFVIFSSFSILGDVWICHFGFKPNDLLVTH